LIRIIIALVLAIPFAVLVDRIYPATYFTESRTFTFMLSVIAGMIAYVLGWHFLIGFSGDDQPRRWVGAYLTIGILTLIFVVLINVLEFAASSAG
jgi:hypothetical protein